MERHPTRFRHRRPDRIRGYRPRSNRRSDTADPDELAGIIRTARLLRGEQIEVTWTAVTMTLGTPEHLPPADVPEAALLLAQPLTVHLNSQVLELNAQRRVYYASAKLADPTTARNAQPGDEVRLVPASNNTAVLAATTPSA
jgi:hypothetical protein